MSYACDGPAKVFINGEEVPVINDGVRVDMRKDGPMDINFLADVHFPAEWNVDGTIVDYESQIRAFDQSNQSVWDPVEIQIKDYTTGEYMPVFRGFVMYIGGPSQGTLERRIRVGDAGQVLERVPYSASYTSGTPVNTILEDVASELEAFTPIFDSVVLRSNSNPELREYTLEVDPGPGMPLGSKVLEFIGSSIEPIGNLLGSFSGGGRVDAKREFVENHDTLEDVIKWTIKKTDGRVYFQPTENAGELALVYDENPTGKEQRARHLGGSTVVKKNNALFEIAPINTLTIRGSSGTSIFGKQIPSFLSASTEFPVATAVHQPLFNRAGTTLQSPSIESDAITIEEAETEVAKELKDQIDNTGGGEIVTLPAPHLHPYEKFISKPACGDNIDHDVPTIEYEIEEVSHIITATGDRSTHLNVSTFADPNDIEITESTMENYDERDPLANLNSEFGRSL